MSAVDPDRIRISGAAASRFKSAQFELTAASGAVRLATGANGGRRRLFIRVMGPSFNPPQSPSSWGARA